MYACLFPDLPTDSLLDRFCGLTKAGQSAIPMGRPALLAAEKDSFGVVTYDGHYHGGIGAREGEVGNAFAGYTVGSFTGCIEDCCSSLGGWERGKVGGRADSFSSCVDGERGLTTASTERISCVPVNEGASLGVNSS